MDRSLPEWERFLPPSSAENSCYSFTGKFADQNVLVTGAGGSIGSALVKALLGGELRSLILLDSSEYSLFEVQRQIAPSPVFCQTVLGSVEDSVLLDDVFSRFSPHVVFHAGAFKHVSLLERNPFAAIKNNALGSYTVAQTALRHGVPKLVLLSTDKAAHPHSVMGVSKRLAELFTVSSSGPVCRMNAIRLGNVIGTSGSVVPIFLDQIKKGQPITITHPQASRYFLSAKEAVEAILAAGIAPCEGKVLIPELREPVRIAELARFLAEVNANGHSGNTSLRFTGLQPGEKLTEDLLAARETQTGTIDGPLTVIQTQRLSREECNEAVERISACVASRQTAGLLEILSSLVPEYVPSQLWKD